MILQTPRFAVANIYHTATPRMYSRPPLTPWNVTSLAAVTPRLNMDIIVMSPSIGMSEYISCFIYSTETPDKPIIPALVSSPAVDESTTLNCESMSRSQPDNHGLTMTSSWKVNDSEVNIQRFSVDGISLVIDPVRYQDKYNVYTCAVREGTSRSSKESDGFKFNPRCKYATYRK